MTRTLKFRAYDQVTGLFYVAFQNPSTIASLPYAWAIDRKSEEIVWQQFTGVTDCKGREIYEGDIITNRLCDEKYCSPAVIVWGKYEYSGWKLAYKYAVEAPIQPILLHQLGNLMLHEEFQLGSTGNAYEVIGNIVHSLDVYACWQV